MREFFGFGGYQREAEGFMSWQHLTFVSVLMLVMVALAMHLGKRYRCRSMREKNKVLAVSAILIDAIEFCKIVLLCIRGKDPMGWLYELPLFLCSVQLIAMPLAAFTKGRLREASLDFVLIFGLLGAVLGTYGAGQNYGCYPVLSFDNVVSGVTHALAGFASLYILMSNMASMQRRNIGITFGILFGFCGAAYIANLILDYNYMFLMRGDGTPYDILFDFVNGSEVLYPLGVVLLFVVYISVFYAVYFYKNKASASSSVRVH